MALKVDLEFNGIQLQDAYIRVNAMIVNYEDNLAAGSLSVHRAAGEPKLGICHNFNNIRIGDSHDARENIYAFIKENVYTNAVDV